MRRLKKPSPQRSAIMRAVKSRDTGPERAVRALAWAIAPGYRLNRRDMPGTPDVVYVSRRLAIFVHGCFWHGHACPRSTVPKTNRAFWIDKIARNRARDSRVAGQLRRAGWRVLTIHECALDKPAAVEAKLRRALAQAPRADEGSNSRLQRPRPRLSQRRGTAT